MKKKATHATSRRFTPHATLAALGIKLRSMKLLKPIEEQVAIPQKTIRHTPLQKLTDALIAILAGARGLVEINTRVRSDQALQRAFGRDGCAEQSVVQETLNACTAKSKHTTLGHYAAFKFSAAHNSATAASISGVS